MEKRGWSNPNYMRKLTFISLCFAISCTQPGEHDNNGKLSDFHTPKYNSSEIADKFNGAFLFYSSNKSLDSFKAIFDEWSTTILPNSNAFADQNDTIKNLYAVFNKVYHPFDLSVLGNWEVKNDFNTMCNYLVIQNKIYYSVLASDTFNSFSLINAKSDSISDFRPFVNLGQKKVLYLVSEYKTALDSFLRSGNSTEKYDVIKGLIPIFHAHTASYWHLETHPKIEAIVFNRGLNEAIVQFQVRYQGGEARLKKSGSDWLLISSKSTWIQ